MSCKECEEASDDKLVYPYRFGRANVGIVACQEHAKEVIHALDFAQRYNLKQLRVLTNFAKQFGDLCNGRESTEADNDEG
jgi:hypothetical protein